MRAAVEAVDADRADSETTLQKADPKGSNAPGDLSPRSCSLVKKGDEQVLDKRFIEWRRIPAKEVRPLIGRRARRARAWQLAIKREKRPVLQGRSRCGAGGSIARASSETRCRGQRSASPRSVALGEPLDFSELSSP
ncbi:unnamed protein product [Rangifer tarandus platyrhynchus]|uniref:Uncharacterized protein n=1 Tax=Rangifer tarandus platyrhynchus TaxID=3082113 RepID=A0AC59YGY7_RANTA